MHVLSVWVGLQDPDGGVEVALEQLVREAPIPHGQLNLSTAGSLRQAGFRFVHAPPPDCHFTVELGTLLSPDEISRFIGAFTETRRNQWTRRE
jgi:hypothetical protein